MVDKSRLIADLVELYRKVACELPSDVETAMTEASLAEEGLAKEALNDIIDNIALSKKNKTPLCQDTGVPIWNIERSQAYTEKFLRDAITEATIKASKDIPLRPNAVNTITDKNSGNNVGTEAPIIYFKEAEEGLKLRLMLKGGGSENIGQLYKLPDTKLEADRNFKGVEKCIYTAVYDAQGKGCPPYILGIGLGGSVDVVTRIAKEQLFRKLQDENPNKELDLLEKKLLRNINTLGIGAAGYGGGKTVLGVKVADVSRHPASYFIYVAFNCWAMRKGELRYD